jgi:hypothetical protein
MSILRRALVFALVVGVASGAALAAHFSAWGPAGLVDPVDGVGVNTLAQDGCPIESPDGGSLYIASNRTGSQALDLWVAHRDGTNEPWGEPVNLNDAPGANLNTAADEFCPTPCEETGSSSFGGRALAALETSTSRASTRRTAGASPSSWPARPRAQTACSTRWAPHTCRQAAGRGSTSRARALRRRARATSSSAEGAPGGPSARRTWSQS